MQSDSSRSLHLLFLIWLFRSAFWLHTPQKKNHGAVRGRIEIVWSFIAWEIQQAYIFNVLEKSRDTHACTLCLSVRVSLCSPFYSWVQVLVFLCLPPLPRAVRFSNLGGAQKTALVRRSWPGFLCGILGPSDLEQITRLVMGFVSVFISD